MSSKALAQALLGYGADIKVKNIVLELFFTALPIVYMSKYKLIDPRDEAILDFFHQYVKSTLRDRNEYGTVALGLVTELFQDVPVNSLSQSEISILAEIAIKRTVYEALERICDKIYLSDVPFEVSNLDNDSAKLSFANSIFAKFFGARKTYEVNFLDDKGKLPKYNQSVDDFKKTTAKYTSRFVRSHNYNANYDKDKVFFFEPYIRFEVKSAGDIALCAEQLKGLQEKGSVRKVLNQIISHMYLLLTGEENFSAVVETSKDGTVTDGLDLFSIGGKSIVCSPDDYTNVNYAFNDQYDYQLYQDSFDDFFNAIFKSINVGVRLVTNKYINLEASKAINKNIKDTGFAEKDIYYQLRINPNFDKFFVGGIETTRALYFDVFSSTMVSKEQKYSPDKIGTVISEVGKFDDLNFLNLISQTSVPDDASIVEGLMYELVRDARFDSIVKSLLSPALLYNSLVTVPTIEAGKDLIPLMRKRGVFQGLDSAVNDMISSLRGYLLGEHPWLRDCSDLEELL